MLKRVAVPIWLALLQVLGLVGSRVFDPQTAPWRFWIALAGFSGGGVILQAVVAAHGKWQAHTARLRDDAQSALMAALVKIIDQTHAPLEHIGLHAYVVRRVRHGLSFRKEQVRIARVRLSENLPASAIMWTEGKGIIGKCWAAGDRPVFWTRDDQSGDLMGCSETVWNQAPESERMGFSYAEWQTGQRYAGVMAVPIQGKDGNGRPRYLGCVSFDLTEPSDWAGIVGAPDLRRAAQKTLLDAARAIREAVEWKD